MYVPFLSIFTPAFSFDTFHNPMDRDIVMLFYRGETQGLESWTLIFKNTTNIFIISQGV